VQSTATTRRSFLQRTATLAAVAQFPSIVRTAPALEGAGDAAESAHAEMWRRFVDPHDVVLDYTDLEGRYDRPTPEECRLGKPNALGWWTPVENGAMFNGLYLDALVNRALATQSDADRAKVRRLVDGELLLARIGEVPGFVARGLATDGRTTFPMGSNDQTAPWFYGLWRYVRAGLADDALRHRIVAKMVKVANVLERTGWRMPAAAPFKFRGSFAESGWDGAPRLLFVMKAMHTLTGDTKWARHYADTLHSKSEHAPHDRLHACSLGVASRPKQMMWTGSVSTACLRELWEMETDAAIRARFARGLTASAEFASGVLPTRSAFDNNGKARFEGDWRKLLPLWRPQRTIADAQAVAAAQLEFKHTLSPRRREEAKFVREPAFAAWIVTLCPEKAIVARHRNAVADTIRCYRYAGLRYSQFFAVESAWWRLRIAA
jgi:hypothetical protein